GDAAVSALADDGRRTTEDRRASGRLSSVLCHSSSSVGPPCSDMRLRIAHRSVSRYDPPAAGVIQVLRLTPRNHEGQYVERWRIDVVPDARLAAHGEVLRNNSHVFTADGPLDELRVEVDGEVETQSANGVVRGTVERFP